MKNSYVFSVSPSCHHWCSGVDWNSYIQERPINMTVTTDAVVWIEILYWPITKLVILSPLMQWCGLKFWDDVPYLLCRESPLMQWCGLKYRAAQRLFTLDKSPLMQWCGLKCHNLADLQKIFRHHWCSGVDWNLQPSGEITVIRCHHWCSGVDWNSGTSIWTVVSTVTTDAVVWIEILIVDNLNHLPSRPPLIQ